MTLTARQREIILTVGREGSGRAAAKALGLSPQTIKNELLTIRRKLNVRSTTAALYLVMHESEVAA